MSDQLNYSKSRWNGWNGNECVFKKDYLKAIEYYNSAIELYPLEYRYFVNRSFCWDQLQRYDMAFEDAQRALNLQPDWGKCYYRMARALKGLKRLEDSQNCFRKVIQLEGNECKEANDELNSINQLLISGISVSTNSTVSVVPIYSDSFDTKDTKSTDHMKSQLISKEKPKNHKRISQKNSLPSMTNISSENCLLLSDSNQLETTVGSETRNNKLFFNLKNGEKNILKELSDLLLNKKVLPFNVQNQCLTTIDIKSPDIKYMTSEQKLAFEDNIPFVPINNEIHSSVEFKTKNNRRNGRKGMDEIVEIWDDSRNHWSSPSNRPQNKCLKTYRKTEPTNLWKFKGLYIKNLIPTDETKRVLHEILAEFGKVTLISIPSDSDTVLVNFDNCESPRMAMSRLQGVHMPNICVNNQKMRIKFRPINESKNYPSSNCLTERPFNNECYFWRTTGCNYPKFCKLKHIPANKGVDLQPWMQNTGNTSKPRYKRQHRNRFEDI